MYRTAERISALKDNLDAMFSPRAIAIVGASPEASKLNGRVLRFLMEGGYAGKIYPVNPKYSETGIAGMRCYNNVAAIPETIDLAIIATGAEHALPELQMEAVANQTASSIVCAKRST